MKIEKELSKTAIFKTVDDWLAASGFQIVNKDESRPWGGFFVINEEQINEFREKFFPEVNLSPEQLKNKLSPKILLVGPDRRLSWQYHHRRAEIWKLVASLPPTRLFEADKKMLVISFCLNSDINWAAQSCTESSP